MTTPTIADEIKNALIGGESIEALLPKQFGAGAEPMGPDAAPVSQDDMIARMFAKARTDAIGDTAQPQGMVPRHDMYWRFCVDENCRAEGHVKRRNYITVATGPKTHKSSDEIERFKKLKHAQPLPQFGQYRHGTVLAADWSHRNPFGFLGMLFSQPGGINLVPRSQLIELGLHRNPLVKSARPDLADFVETYCPHNCPAPDDRGPKWFANEMDLGAHVMVAHKEAVASTAVGKAVTEGIAAVLASRDAAGLAGGPAGGGMSPEVIQAMASAFMQVLSAGAAQAVPTVATPPVEAPTLAAPPVEDAPEGLSPRARRGPAEADQSARDPE